MGGSGGNGGENVGWLRLKYVVYICQNSNLEEGKKTWTDISPQKIKKYPVSMLSKIKILISSKASSYEE